MLMRKSRSRAGFTLVEMLVVIAIIATLAAMLLPAVQKARAAAARAKCQNNLRQLALACHNYHDSFKHFPAGVTGDLSQNRGWGWGAQLLPFIDQNPVAQNIDLTQPFGPTNAGKNVPLGNTNNPGVVQTNTVPATQMWIQVYVCPSDTSAPISGFSAGGMNLGPTSYAAICGNDATNVATATSSTNANGIFYVDSATTIEGVKDGTSQTALIGEKAWGQCENAWAGVPGLGAGPAYLAANVGQAGPENMSNPGSTFDGKRMVMSHCHLINIQGPDADGSGGTDDVYSNHPAGANVAFADGHVSFIKSIPYDPSGVYSQDSLSWQALGTRASGDAPAPGFDY